MTAGRHFERTFVRRCRSGEAETLSHNILTDWCQIPVRPAGSPFGTSGILLTICREHLISIGQDVKDYMDSFILTIIESLMCDMIVEPPHLAGNQTDVWLSHCILLPERDFSTR